MSDNQLLSEGQILTGSLFSEPMRVETVRANGPDTWVAGLVGTQSERFRKVTLTTRDIEGLTILDARLSYDGNGRLLRLGLQAYSLGIAYEFDPYFGLSISRVAEDGRDCYWLYVVTNCGRKPQLQEPIKDPAGLLWEKVVEVGHHALRLQDLARAEP